MKVNLKTDPETLFLLHQIINKECQMIADNIGRRSGKSMRIELFTTLTQRCMSYSSNPTGKKLGLTLKYHLAAMLYEIIIQYYYSMKVYERTKLEIFKNELHQKLL